MTYILQVSDQKTLTFSVLACAVLFQTLYGGQIRYENVEKR